VRTGKLNQPTLFKRAALALCALAVLTSCGRNASENNAETGESVASQSGPTPPELADLGGPASADVRALYAGEFQSFGVLSGVGEGDEGAWELVLSDEFAQFVRPGLQDVVSYSVAREIFAKGARANAGPLTITLAQAPCALPNGTALDYTASVVFEDIVYEGCARRGVTAPGERLTWAVALPELLPAINACLDRQEGRRATVTVASLLPPEQDGAQLVTVRLREADQTRRECLATRDGTEVRSFEYVPESAGEGRGGEGDAEYTRAPGPAPREGQCRAVEAVPGVGGAPSGWLMRRTC
jgi:hypothetical protein